MRTRSTNHNIFRDRKGRKGKETGGNKRKRIWRTERAYDIRRVVERAVATGENAVPASLSRSARRFIVAREPRAKITRHWRQIGIVDLFSASLPRCSVEKRYSKVEANCLLRELLTERPGQESCDMFSRSGCIFEGVLFLRRNGSGHELSRRCLYREKERLARWLVLFLLPNPSRASFSLKLVIHKRICTSYRRIRVCVVFGQRS